MFKIAIALVAGVAASAMLFPHEAEAPHANMVYAKVQTLTAADVPIPATPLAEVQVELAPEPEPVPEPPAPTPAPTQAPAFQPPANLPPPEPGTAQAYAKEHLLQFGHGESEYACLVSLWNRESGWNYQAMNRSSGAYGIPQSLPGNKMASAGADWETNPETQIRWGVSYINARYGTPCGAWAHSERVGWY